MNPTAEPRRILHPTNLEAAASGAFTHALRLALSARATLTLLHAGEEDDRTMGAMPQVRETLRNWGLLRSADGAQELKDLGVGVRKLLVSGDPVQACADYLEEHRCDLVVLHTHQREGGAAWLGGRVAEPVAREAQQPVLIVPGGAQGFVDPATGALRLQRILVPIDRAPAPDAAVQLAGWLLETLGVEDAEVMLLHAGREDRAPHVHPPHRPGWQWQLNVQEGEAVETIMRVERAWQPHLVVMTTQGHDGILDALRGSTTERVLRQIRCPLLTRTLKPD